MLLVLRVQCLPLSVLVPDLGGYKQLLAFAVDRGPLVHVLARLDGAHSALAAWLAYADGPVVEFVHVQAVAARLWPVGKGLVALATLRVDAALHLFALGNSLPLGIEAVVSLVELLVEGAVGALVDLRRVGLALEQLGEDALLGVVALTHLSDQALPLHRIATSWPLQIDLLEVVLLPNLLALLAGVRPAGRVASSRLGSLGRLRQHADLVLQLG